MTHADYLYRSPIAFQYFPDAYIWSGSSMIFIGLTESSWLNSKTKIHITSSTEILELADPPKDALTADRGDN